MLLIIKQSDYSLKNETKIALVQTFDGCRSHIDWLEMCCQKVKSLRRQAVWEEFFRALGYFAMCAARARSSRKSFSEQQIEKELSSKRNLVQNIVANARRHVRRGLFYSRLADFFKRCNESCLSCLKLCRYLSVTDIIFKKDAEVKCLFRTSKSQGERHYEKIYFL